MGMIRERRVIVAGCGRSYPGQVACHGAVRLARTVLDRLGIEPDQYIVVTDLDIRSSGRLGIEPRDIDAVAFAGWVRDDATCNPRRRNHGAD
jgi:uncharacterized metal-binding protein